ncbi:YjgP/YjgQ family permease, partial [bacterium]
LKGIPRRAHDRRSLAPRDDPGGDVRRLPLHRLRQPLSRRADPLPLLRRALPAQPGQGQDVRSADGPQAYRRVDRGRRRTGGHPVGDHPRPRRRDWRDHRHSWPRLPRDVSRLQAQRTNGLRKLDWYVFKEMFVPFLAGTFVVALLFQANSYIYLAKTFNLDNVPILARVQWLLYTLPSQLKLTLPTGMALAAALSVGRMGRESEVTALRAAGTSVFRLLRPVILFGLLAGALNYYIVDRMIPTYTGKAKELERKNALLAAAPSDFTTNAFIKLDRYAASLGEVRRTADDNLSIRDVMLIERGADKVKSIFTAPEGTYDAGLWEFPSGAAFMVKGTELTSMEAKSMTID